MGLAARVSVPPELQHYSDRRRFLAVQMADSHEEHYDLPEDDADLVAMLRSVVVDALDVRGVAADRLAAELRDALGEHLLALGQHPHRTLARTVEDWLLGASRGELITELQRAASWWRAALTPGRLR